MQGLRRGSIKSSQGQRFSNVYLHTCLAGKARLLEPETGFKNASSICMPFRTKYPAYFGQRSQMLKDMLLYSFIEIERDFICTLILGLSSILF